MIVRSLEDVFPYSEFRKYQRGLIDKIYDVFSSNKIGVVYAPTGIGKTISVLTAHLLEPTDKLIILTRTKNQAAIYSKELDRIKKKLGDLQYVFIRSKHDFCAIASRSEKIRNLPYTVFIKICEYLKKRGRCPYYSQTIVNGEFSDLVREVGSSLFETGATASRIVRTAIHNKLCPYELARYLARISNIVVGTYSYIFNPKIRDLFLGGL